MFDFTIAEEEECRDLVSGVTYFSYDYDSGFAMVFTASDNPKVTITGSSSTVKANSFVAVVQGEIVLYPAKMITHAFGNTRKCRLATESEKELMKACVKSVKAIPIDDMLEYYTGNHLIGYTNLTSELWGFTERCKYIYPISEHLDRYKHAKVSVRSNTRGTVKTITMAEFLKMSE